MYSEKTNKRESKQASAKKSKNYAGKYSSKHVRIVEEQKNKSKTSDYYNTCHHTASNK